MRTGDGKEGGVRGWRGGIAAAAASCCVVTTIDVMYVECDDVLEE